MFALALLLTYITYRDFESFMIWLTIFCGFIVWGGLLPLWVLILNLVVISLIIVNIVYRKRGIE